MDTAVTATRVCASDAEAIARLRARLTDVRYYSLDNEFSGTTATPSDAWDALDTHAEARLVEINALLGVYKIVIGDHRWYGLRPAVEFIPATLRELTLAYKHAAGAREAAEREVKAASQQAARRALELIPMAVRETYPDAVLLELHPNSYNMEAYGFIPEETVFLSDGTEVPPAADLVHFLVPLTVEFDETVREVWGEHIQRFIGRSGRIYLLDLRDPLTSQGHAA
ncbi:hypothetical protein ABZ502_32660 [Streptomyces abikoensis]|uniref:hypothetical protein n=1 Tax=Streptomyces abikoensis TaxID=97398 RepID=UPI0033CE9F5B